MNQKFDLVVMNPKEINTFVARVNFANVIPKSTWVRKCGVFQVQEQFCNPF